MTAEARDTSTSTSSAVSPSLPPSSPNSTSGERRLLRRLSWNSSDELRLPPQSVSPYGGRSASPYVETPSGMTSVPLSRGDSTDSVTGLQVVTQPRISISRRPSVTLEDDAASLEVLDGDMQQLTPRVENSGTFAMLDMSAGASAPFNARRAATYRVRPDRLRSAAEPLRRISTQIARRVANVRGVEEQVKPIRLVDHEDVDSEQDEPYRPADTDSSKNISVLRRDTEASLERGYTESQDTRVAGQLEGRTLGIFGANNWLRKTLFKILMFPLTEPLILLLIVLNAIVLTIQSVAPLNTPRVDDGYFTDWADSVLFSLFIAFTAEMFARIIVSGLILDATVKVSDLWETNPNTNVILDKPTSHTGVYRNQFKSFRQNINQAATLQGPDRSPTRAPPPSEGVRQHLAANQRWKDHGQHYEARGRQQSRDSGWKSNLPEAPFQEAIGKQKGLLEAQRPYLRHSWHRIDMLAIVCFWVMFALAITKVEATDTRHIYIFRALSVLRTSRLLLVTSGTATIMHSLKRAGPLLIRVAIFAVFALVLFSIIGEQSFSGSFRRTCLLTDPNNSSNVITLGNQCGGWINGTDFTVVGWLNENGVNTTSPKGYICPLGQVCQMTDQNPNDGAESFDNIAAAMVQVLVIASANTWSPVMYSLMDSDYRFSFLYSICALIVLNFWVINLLVAVVVNTFQSIRAETKKSAFGGELIAKAKRQGGFGSPVIMTRGENRAKKMYEKTQLFWVLLVLVNVVALGAKSHKSSQRFIDVIGYIDLGCSFAFGLEIIIRILACSPAWTSFFNSGRNVFDLFLAIVTLIFQIPLIKTTPVAPWFTVFALLRWYRFILVVPRMKPLLSTVFGSFGGLGNMVMFLLIMNYVATLIALQLFRGDITDTSLLISFNQVYNGFIGMYQILSSENWTTPLYSAMTTGFDQEVVTAIFLCAWFLFANFVLIQMFIAVINENFDVSEDLKRRQQLDAYNRALAPMAVQKSWWDRFNPYRVVTATIPQSTGNIGELHLGVAAPGNTVEDFADMKDHRTTMLSEGEITDRDGQPLIPARNLPFRRGTLPERDAEEDRGLTDMLLNRPPLAALSGYEESKRLRRKDQAQFIVNHPSYDKVFWLIGQSNPIRRACQYIVTPSAGDRIFGARPRRRARFVFRIILIATVIASLIMAIIATPLYRKSYFEKHGIQRATWFNLAELALMVIFLAEFLIKVLADGFLFCPNAYMLSLWNRIDFIVLVALFFSTTTSVIYAGGLSRFTRALTAFRAFRLITLSQRMRNAFDAVLVGGAMRILDACVLMLLYLIPFAVWGVNIFAGQLYQCNDSNSAGMADCVSEYLSSPVDPSLSFLAPRVWDNPNDSASSWSFDSFRASLLILFETVSLEGWIDVMGSLMNIEGLGLQPHTNASQWNGMFMVIFNLFGAVITLALFLSIIISNFARRTGQSLLTVKQRHWVNLYGFLLRQTPSRRPIADEQSAVRRWCLERAVRKNGPWARFFSILCYVQIVLLMAQNYSGNMISQTVAEILYLIVSVLFALNIAVRFYGLGWRSYIADGWNFFEVFIITGALTTTCLRLGGNENGGLLQLQKLFMVAITFKLVQTNSRLNQLFKASASSLPSIGNLFLLWATIFIFFAIMFVEVFGLTKVGQANFSRFTNYQTVGNALLMLSFCSTGEGWNGFMHDYTISYPRCTENPSFLKSDCGSPAWAFALFIAWNILSMYIILNVFTAIVVESFAYIYDSSGGTSISRDQMRSFKKVWAQFDRNNMGHISREDLGRFLSKMPHVFDVRPHTGKFTVRGLLSDAAANVESDPADVVSGKRHALDVRKLDIALASMDLEEIRQRRRTYNRLYHEARLVETPGKGISFTNMLMLLAHYKLIDDNEALQIDDLVARRERVQRVEDMVNLDLVRSVLRQIYCRRRYLDMRQEENRTLNPEARGVPAIVLAPIVTSFVEREAGGRGRSPQPSSPGSSGLPSPSSWTREGMLDEHDTGLLPRSPERSPSASKFPAFVVNSNRSASEVVDPYSFSADETNPFSRDLNDFERPTRSSRDRDEQEAA